MLGLLSQDSTPFPVTQLRWLTSANEEIVNSDSPGAFTHYETGVMSTIVTLFGQRSSSRCDFLNFRRSEETGERIVVGGRSSGSTVSVSLSLGRRSAQHVENFTGAIAYPANTKVNALLQGIYES